MYKALYRRDDIDWLYVSRKGASDFKEFKIASEHR